MILEINEQKQLIEKFVKTNPKFVGNEDLFDDFCNETFQKCYIIFNSDSGISKIENYVRKVVNTSILSVLKDSGRLKRTSSGYEKVNEVPLEIPIKVNIEDPLKYLYDIEDPVSKFEETAVAKELLQKIFHAVRVMHSENKEKNYCEIFVARYFEGKKQKQIAAEINISQSEVSKRLFEISKYVKQYIK